MTNSSTQDNNEKTISVRSLTQEITGVRQWTPQDVKSGKDAGTQELAFDAAYQELKRILACLKAIAKIDRPIKLNRQNVGAIKIVLHAMYFDGDLRSIFIKLRAGKPLTQMEYHRLLFFLVATLSDQHQGLTENMLRDLKEKMKFADYQNFIDHHVAVLAREYTFIKQPSDVAMQVKKFAAFQCSLCKAVENFHTLYESTTQAKPNKSPIKKQSPTGDAIELALRLLLENNENNLVE